MENPNIIRNKYGYFEVGNKPSESELREYYSQKYYQEAHGGYEKEYSEEEIVFFNNKIAEKYFVIENIAGKGTLTSLLDIGCGEGWTLNYFKNLDAKVLGLDYSSYGCEKFNPLCTEYLIAGDIYGSIESLINEERKFDIIWLDNVLEHVADPSGLLKKCYSLASENGVLVIEVPNDFSELQQYLLSKKYIDNEFWVALPDHLSYFNKEGLNLLALDSGWVNKFIMGNYPVDFNILNKNTNYVIDKSRGKSCYKASIEADNLCHSISVEKTVELYKTLGEMGLGRQIIAFYTKKK